MPIPAPLPIGCGSRITSILRRKSYGSQSERGLSYFRDELGGSFLTVRELHDQLRTGASPGISDGPLPPQSRQTEARWSLPKAEATKRCLVVANVFPPIHGGSAIVYDSLARFGDGRVSVLAPKEDYRDGWPIQGWRELDRQAPFKVHRMR